MKHYFSANLVRTFSTMTFLSQQNNTKNTKMKTK